MTENEDHIRTTGCAVCLRLSLTLKLVDGYATLVEMVPQEVDERQTAGRSAGSSTGRQKWLGRLDEAVWPIPGDDLAVPDDATGQ